MAGRVFLGPWSECNPHCESHSGSKLTRAQYNSLRDFRGAKLPAHNGRRTAEDAATMRILESNMRVRVGYVATCRSQAATPLPRTEEELLRSTPRLVQYDADFNKAAAK